MTDPLNIIIPVYNEGENILKTLNEINLKVKTPHQIFIIYDFEEDNTLPVVKDLIPQSKHIHLTKNNYGRGALNAIKSGFNEVKEIVYGTLDRHGLLP